MIGYSEYPIIKLYEFFKKCQNFEKYITLDYILVQREVLLGSSVAKIQI
jgi:hypothetical protein